MVKLNVFALAVAALLATDYAVAQNAALPTEAPETLKVPAVTPAATELTVLSVTPSAAQSVTPATTAPSPTPATTAPSPTPATTAPSPTPASTTPTPTPASTTPTPTPAASFSFSPAPPSSPHLTVPNWVGALKGKPIDSACYRKSYITKNKQCGVGYTFDKVTTCWAQCPIEYPVACGMECIPQNHDCTLAVLRKIGSVGNVALNAATSGVFGQLGKASKGVQTGVKCGQQLFTSVNKVIGFINEVEKGGKTDTTKEQLSYLLSKSDFVVVDLPVAVATCIGVNMPKGVDQAKQVVDTVKKIVEKVIDTKTGGFQIMSPDALAPFAAEVGLGKSVSTLTEADKQTLNQLVTTGFTCGPQIKSVVDKIVIAVKDLKTTKPTTTVDMLKFAVLNSDLVLKELPEATVGCVETNAPEGFKNRDQILKTVHVILDRVVEASSQNGNPVSTADYAITVANMGLDAIAMFDPTGLANMAAEFIQPICGPTAYIGDIDDGPADKAVGLTTVQKAFRNSSGTWAKTGDGHLRIKFESVDDKNVRVNVFSGGKKLYEVPVKKGETVTWSKPLTEFQGKTLYLDRWRPGFLGIPGTGGGSFLAWVPMDSDGALDLTVKINPTTFSDHALRRRLHD